VGEDDPIGVPREHAGDLLPGGDSIPDQHAFEPGGARPAASHPARHDPGEAGRVLREVEDRVGADQCPAGAVEEHDLVLERAGREQDLIELAAPLELWLVAEDATPGDVGASLPLRVG